MNKPHVYVEGEPECFETPPCALCFGTGEALVKTGLMEKDYTETCPVCGGSGVSPPEDLA